MRIVINTTTFPASEHDPVPAFVLDQVKHLFARDGSLDMDVLIPHNAYNLDTAGKRQFNSHREHRYHYFFPHHLEKLTGRGILPAIRENPLRVLMIPFLVFCQYLALRRLCDEAKPDLVYAHWFTTPAIVSYFVCRKRGIPLFFTTHASDVSVLDRIPFAKYLIGKVLDYSSGFTAVSNRTANKLMAFFDDKEWQEIYRHKLSILPMGTDLEDVKIDKLKMNELVSDAGVDPARKFILCMGRLSEKKGFEYLIDAYARLTAEQRNEYQLVVAGDGQLMEKLLTRSTATGCGSDIIFTGHVKGHLKSTLLAMADVFVIPSIIDSKGDSEGLPVVMMEALAKGKVVIATNVSGAEEVLSAKEGYIVEQRSADALVEALNSFFENQPAQKKKMQAGAKALSKTFGWEQIADRHLELLVAAGDAK